MRTLARGNGRPSHDAPTALSARRTCGVHLVRQALPQGHRLHAHVGGAAVVLLAQAPAAVRVVGLRVHLLPVCHWCVRVVCCRGAVVGALLSRAHAPQEQQQRWPGASRGAHTHARTHHCGGRNLALAARWDSPAARAASLLVAMARRCFCASCRATAGQGTSLATPLRASLAPCSECVTPSCVYRARVLSL